MMKSNHSTNRSSAARYLSAIKPSQLRAAADTLEKLQEHDFEASSILNTAVARYVCSHSTDFTLVCDKGLPRLRYKHTISDYEKPIVAQKAKALSDEGWVHCSRALEQQLSTLGHVCQSIRQLRDGVSLSFPRCIEVLSGPLLQNLHEESRDKAVLRKDTQAVKEIIDLFRRCASELKDGSVPQETKISPATQPLRAHKKNRLRMPPVPGVRRRWPQKQGLYKQPVSDAKTEMPKAEIPADTSVSSQKPSVEDVAFYHSWLTTEFGIKPRVAQELAPLFCTDSMENLTHAFKSVHDSLRRQLGARYPQIFNPRGDENWATYVQYLTEATELAGGISQVTQYLGSMQSSQSLKGLVKELKKRR